MAQLELFSDKEEQYLAQDFVEVDEVIPVLNILRNFLGCSIYDNKQVPNIIVKGHKNSGKTHLVRFLQQQYQLNIVSADMDFIGLFQEGEFYIFEDIDRINNDELLLNIINLAKESKAFLLFTLTKDIKTKIKDLDSRLKNFFIKCEIKKLSDETIRQFAVGYLSRNQIKPTNKEIKRVISAKWCD